MNLPNELSEFITEADHFGPIAMDSVDEPVVIDLLYDQHNKIHKDAQTKCPAFIIGRKGAGKTAFLKAPMIDPTNRVIELTSFDAFAGIVDLINRLEGYNLTLFIEHAGQLWEYAIWVTIFGELLHPGVPTAGLSEERRQIGAFLTGLLGSSRPRADPVEIMGSYARTVAEQLETEGSYNPLRTRLEAIECGGITLKAAKAAATTILTTTKTHLFVLMDSMESFHMELDRVQKALGGLFRFIGQHATTRPRLYEVRFCFPTELWHRLHRLSVNPVKDFHSQITLHWHSKELVRIVAQRFSLYLRLYHPDLLAETFDRGRYDPNRTDHALQLLGAILPTKVTNRFGQEEESLAYILRHTQLLPRQLLGLMNRISQRNERLGNPPHRLAPNAVVEGVRDTEEEHVADILIAYSAVHPAARMFCERSIPHLPLRFSNGLLHRIFNEAGVKKLTGVEFEEFRTALIEVGCIGRVVQEKQQYLLGEFEYTVPHRLIMSHEDELCLHPLFTRIFSSRVRKGKGDFGAIKPVYPFGASIDSEDYRDA